MPRKARTQRQIEHVQDDILMAAARAVARHGLDATTIHHIAKEAGYTTQTLYSYFPGRQQILDGLVSQMTGEILAVFDVDDPPGLTFRQRLELLQRRHLAIAERWQQAFAVLFAVRMSRDPAVAALRQGKPLTGVGFDDPFLRRLVKWIEDTARPEDIGGYDPVTVAHFFKAVSSTFFLRWVQGDRNAPLGADVGTVIDLFFHGVSRPSSGAASPASSPRKSRRTTRAATIAAEPTEQRDVDPASRVRTAQRGKK